MPRAFDYLVDAAGLAQVMFDTPDKRVNLWSAETLDELEQVLAELTARGDLAGVVFRSAKLDTFIAGADIEMLASVDSRESAIALARRGQEVFQRVADVSVPTVAAILFLPCRNRRSLDPTRISRSAARDHPSLGRYATRATTDRASACVAADPDQPVGVGKPCQADRLGGSGSSSFEVG